jgi:SAM-dependent methyltransferase
MQPYNKSFARAYNLMWTDFADRAAPHIIEFYGATAAGKDRKPVLDLCCGAGTLALHFLAEGYDVTGVDLSPHMLEYARDNAAEYIEAGRARFIEADVTEFEVEGRFGLAVSTYDSLNHLDGQESLKKCFALTREVLAPGGFFVFDLNTRTGLKHWGELSMEEDENVTVIRTGGYDYRNHRAFYRTTGFIRNDDGFFEKFEEMLVETVFEMDQVKDLLIGAGFLSAYFAKMTDLTEPITEPEKEDRVFFVAAR